MTHPYIPPQPGGPGAYEQQLTARAHRAEQDRATLETELGQARQRNAELQERLDLSRAGASEREDLLTEARDLLEPWGGHGEGWPSLTPAIGELIEKLNAALVRAENAETARDQLAAGAVLVCSDERHAAKVRGLEALLIEGQKATKHWEDAYTREVAAHGQTEARLAELEEDEDDWLTGVLYARKLSILNVPLVSPAFTGDTTDPWEAAAEAARQHELVKQRIAEHLASDPVPGARQIVILPPQPVRPGPMIFQPCTATEAAPAITFDDLATVINEYRMPEHRTVPRREMQRSEPPSTGLTVVTTDPVEEIAAEPATLERLKSQFFTAPATRLGAQVGEIGAFFGFPLIPDPQLPPGEVHMRPHPRAEDRP